MSYSLATSSTGFEINDSASISFGEDSILFQCKYARSVSVDHGITIQETPDAVVSTGDLTYTMAVTVGELGGNTEVRITPNHGFDQLAPR